MAPLSSSTVRVLTAAPVETGASFTSQIVVASVLVTPAIGVVPPFVVVSTVTRVVLVVPLVNPPA